MKPTISHLPPKAAELFRTIQSKYSHIGDSPLVKERKTWLEFLVAVHASKGHRLTGPEFYEFLTGEQGWRNDLAQGVVVEYTLALELLDFVAAR